MKLVIRILIDAHRVPKSLTITNLSSDKETALKSLYKIIYKSYQSNKYKKPTVPIPIHPNKDPTSCISFKYLGIKLKTSLSIE